MYNNSALYAAKRPHCFEIGSVGLHSKNLLGPECCRHFTNTVNGSLDSLTFETMVEDMLESLLDFFEQLGDEENVHTDFDVTYSSGVLTVHFGPNHGTYVINKQTPNKQIWLSSPTSGPKRYDLMGNDWVYSHDGVPMLRLLSEEISTILGKSVNLYKVIKLKET
ncbi:frataxin, mitochondrial-like isoform X2 [Patiria miniata]|uniref:ferroxidase n=1 Tax=Patiria miniata TaxID=46514 RepID=A0A914AZZ5_PATMI|nr:frataxin, mitochondrial-like isoform X2 [Patiria miniata]